MTENPLDLQVVLGLSLIQVDVVKQSGWTCQTCGAILASSAGPATDWCEKLDRWRKPGETIA